MTQHVAAESAPVGSSDRIVRSDARPIALVDLLDRLLGTGVVLAGDVVISLAGVDLVELSIRALLRTVQDEDRP
jgi:gas vesicle protein GvpA/GvpJ/GvpM family